MRETVRRMLGPLFPAVRWVRDRGARREVEQWLDAIAAPFGGYEGKRILDVGSDLHGNLIRVLARRFSPREVRGINLNAINTQFGGGVHLDRGDIRQTPYADHSFDLIISSSAFEHIRGLESAMAEMYRILKPGGHLFSHFGPIWSTSYGHHLWTEHRGKFHTYWDLILPPYCHLVMSRDEIEQWLVARGHDAELSRVVAGYVTSSEEQNQLFYEDYEAIFKRTQFEILVFKGYDHPTLARVYNARLTGQVLDRLKATYPDKTNFFYDGITTLMRKQ